MLDPERIKSAILVAVARARPDDWLPCTIGDLRNRVAEIDPDASNADDLIGAIGALATEQLLLVRKISYDSPGPIPFSLLKQHDKTYTSDFFFRGNFELKLAEIGKSRVFESGLQFRSAVDQAGKGAATAGRPGIARIAPPSVAIAFGAAKIPLGGTSSLTFILNNSNPKDKLNGIAFADQLPAGLVVSSSREIVNSCGGTVTAAAGSNSISLSGASLDPLTSGTLVVNITGATAGVKVNSVKITSTEGGNGDTANASVVVVAPPIITKAFDPEIIAIGQATRLTFKINNPNGVSQLTGIGFADSLPAGLIISNPNGLVGSWADGTVTAPPGANRIVLSGAALPPNGSCSFQLLVTCTREGTMNNATGNVTSQEGGHGNTASASIIAVAGVPESKVSSTSGFGRSAAPDDVAEADNTISEVAKRAIVDYLSLSGNWSGRFSDVEFLARLYDLNKLPSTDYRFKTAYEDIWQHRVNNPGDWPSDWVFTDSRFNLLYGPDQELLRFLSETVHPVVRPNLDEAHRMVAEFNEHLAADGWEIAEEKRISGKPLFSPRRVAGHSVQLPPQQSASRTEAATASQAKTPDEIGKDVKASGAEQPPAAFSYTARGTRVLVAAAGYTRNCRDSGEYTLRGSSIMYALIDFALERKLEADDAAHVLGAVAREAGIERYQRERRNYLKEGLPGGLPVTTFDGEPLELAFRNVSPSSRGLLQEADRIARVTDALYPSRPVAIDTRHLIAASITTLLDVYSRLGVSMEPLRINLYSFLDQHYSSKDLLDKWAEVLEIPRDEVLRVGPGTSVSSPMPVVSETEDNILQVDTTTRPDQAESSTRDWLPGVSSDRSGEEDPDLLNIQREVHALCSVIAAKDAALPLSIGLFGDWGTGKSFFMKEMELEIKKLSKRGSPYCYCSNIVQLKFNAWHYIDTNLWASLTAEIFEGLASAVSTTPAVKQGNKAERLLAELATSRDRVVDAERRKKEVESHLAQSEQRREELIANLTLRESARLVIDQREIREKLDEAAKALKLSEVDRAALETRSELLKLQGVGGAIRTIAQVIRHASWLWLAAVTFVVLAAWFGFRWILPWARGNQVLGQGITWSLSILAFLGPFVRRAAKVIALVGQARAKTEEIIKKDREVKEGQLRAEQESIDAARTEVQHLEEELVKLRADRQMFDFIRRRNESTDYSSHRGVIARSHKDFLELSVFLEKVNNEAIGDQPRIERIVLYIDDLDRCPEKKVMQVLQAVHLLLAFPLFVVVVGVDPRWLLHSVTSSSRAFRPRSDSEHTANEDQRAVWQSTPLNYLEKIFQIPFTLAPMTAAGYGKIIDEGAKVRESRSIQPAGSGANVALPRGVGAAEGPGPLASVGAGLEVSAPQAELPVEVPAEVNNHSGYSVVQTVESDAVAERPAPLRIEEWEREFMKELYILIPSPRASKRFVNIYRLIRATIEPSTLDSFVGNAEQGEHRAVLMLLAILIGHPCAAAELLKELIENEHNETWWEFVEAFEKKKCDPFVARDKSGLVSGLSGLRSLIPESQRCEVFKRHATQVARYSFQSGRVLLEKRESKGFLAWNKGEAERMGRIP